MREVSSQDFGVCLILIFMVLAPVFGTKKPARIAPAGAFVHTDEMTHSSFFVSRQAVVRGQGIEASPGTYPVNKGWGLIPLA
jgi:hypothetical protein